MKPPRLESFANLTCDSNGKLARFIRDCQEKQLLERLRLASEEAIAQYQVTISEARLLMTPLRASSSQTTT